MSWRYAVSKPWKPTETSDSLYGWQPSTATTTTTTKKYSTSPSNHHHHRSDSLGRPTTSRELQHVLLYSITPCRPLPRLRRSDCQVYDVDCDEVFSKLYVGDAASAKNKNFLRYMGFTHVLNTAEGSRIGQVDTGHLYYRDMPNVRYMGFPLIDQATTDISRYFYIASKFIENGINSGGKVLVHCLMGVSRSATCAIVYLMIARKMTASEAIRLVRLHREIRPNDGFLQQIADLDNELKRERLYSY